MYGMGSILPGDWIMQSGPVAASLGIFIGALLMILIAVSYGAWLSAFPFLVVHCI